jgi:FtsP/CotA-like multicopper oxidase with cupredoxin domain
MRIPARAFALSLALVPVLDCAPSVPHGGLLDPKTQPHWVNQLRIPPVYAPGTIPGDPDADAYEIHVTQFQTWMGLVDPVTSRRLYTTVWGFGQVGQKYDTGVLAADGTPVLQTGTYMAPTLEAVRGRRVVVRWIDDRRDAAGRPLQRHLLEEAYDTTLHGASEGEPHVRMVTHLHGAEVPPVSDGLPDDWFTPDPSARPNGRGGPAGNSLVDTYPNEQPATTLFYHDHTLGITRLNVMAMGAGLYLLRDPRVDAGLDLPSGAYEIPLTLADRMFDEGGSLSYLNAANPAGTAYHPRQPPEFFGDVVTVNGMAWPVLDVEPRRYRFRLVDASNARMYDLRLVDLASGAPWPHVVQIGSDGGYLAAPVPLAMDPIPEDDAHDTSTRLFLAPGERADVVVDFTGLAAGTDLVFANDAPAPFPDGDEPDPAGVGQILRFHVVPLTGPDPSRIPEKLNPLPTRLDPGAVSVVRHLALNEVEDPASGNPVIGLLGNTCWDAPVSETPAVGATEIWEIADTTPDTHPIHLHLVQLNLLDRQAFDVAGYLEAWNARSPRRGDLPGPPPTCPVMADPVNPPGVATWPQVVPDATPFLTGSPLPPAAHEAGWKDTVRVKKGTVTRFLVRFAPQDPAARGPYGGYSFDPTRGPYVWHCHILDHEDNEMMRPFQLTR